MGSFVSAYPVTGSFGRFVCLCVCFYIVIITVMFILTCFLSHPGQLWTPRLEFALQLEGLSPVSCDTSAFTFSSSAPLWPFMLSNSKLSSLHISLVSFFLGEIKRLIMQVGDTARTMFVQECKSLSSSLSQHPSHLKNNKNAPWSQNQNNNHVFLLFWCK